MPSQEDKETQRLQQDYCAYSLNTLSLDNGIRRWTISLVENKWSDYFIIFLIGINSIILGARNYKWREDDGTPMPKINALVEFMEPIFTTCFTIECVIKITARGLWFGNYNCYL